jgi:RHS repeat-associated protein
MFNQAGQVLSTTDYRPFGSPLTSVGITSRTTYYDRERDAEASIGAYGARLYSSEYGRFLAVDKLWEKYRSLQPYQYAGNSPVMAVDRNGKEIQVVDPETGTAYVFDGSQLVSKDDGAVLQDAQGFVKVVQDGLLRLMQMKDNAQDIGTLIRSDLVTTISMNSVDGSEVLSNHPNGPTEGAALATYDGVGSDALMRLSPAVMTKTFQESTVELAHEARHAYHIVTGTRADEAEVQGLMAENAARYELGLPLRLSYGDVPYPSCRVVPWWIPRSR